MHGRTGNSETPTMTPIWALSATQSPGRSNTLLQALRAQHVTESVVQEPPTVSSKKHVLCQLSRSAML